MGWYSLSPSVFYADALFPSLNGNGATGAGYLGGSGVQAMGVLPLPLRDGGPSASSNLIYAFGCMNYFAMTGTCPKDLATGWPAIVRAVHEMPQALYKKFLLQVMVNPWPAVVGYNDSDFNTTQQLVPVTVTGVSF